MLRTGARYVRRSTAKSATMGLANGATRSYSITAVKHLMPLVGFLPPDDPRIKGTVETIQNNLMNDGFLMRYSLAEGADGVPGD